MVLYDILRQLPLLTAVVCFAITASQVWKGRVATWTEAFFLCAFFFLGLYAFSDWLLFNVALESTAYLVTLIDLWSLTVSVLYFSLFTRVFLDRFRPFDIFLSVPTIAAIVAVPTAMVESVTQQPFPGSAPIFRVTYHHPAIELWLLYVLAYIGFGIYNLWRLYRVVRQQSTHMATKVLGLIITFLAAIVLGFFTNGLIETLGIPAFPLFSAAMFGPSVMTAMVLGQVSGRRLSEMVREWKRRRAEVKAAYLIFEDGTLIEQKGHLGNSMDNDLFVATLDVISNFMRTSFPLLRGNWLKTIDHGDVRIVLERGKYTYLAIVIAGEEEDLLRRQMRDEIEDFERKNAQMLRRWRGVLDDARGAREMLTRFFSPGVLF